MSEPAAKPLHRICPSCDVEINDDRTDRACPTCGAKLIEVGNAKDELIGSVIDGRFEIRSLLGQGGMGSVYRAWQRSVGREVAIKVIDRAFARDAMAVRRFLREAKLASQLSQPNTVSVFDFGQAEDGRLFIAMELIKGRTLHEVLVTDGVFSIARAVRVGMQICDALEAAHTLNIMHRDMKLENLIVLDHPPGRDLVKVLDFGLAKTLGDDQSRGTQSGVVVGTPRYMAPEAAMSGLALPAGDMYALGVILAELTIGRALWSDVSLPALVAQKLDPSGIVADLPPALRDVVGRLLEPEPEARPTAAHTRALLAAVVETPSAPALPVAKASPIASTLDLDPIKASASASASAKTSVTPTGSPIGSAPAMPRAGAANPLAYAPTSASGPSELRVVVSTPAATPRPAIASAVVPVVPLGTGVTLMPSTASQATVESRRRGVLVGGIIAGCAVVVGVVVVVLATRGGGSAHAPAAPTAPANAVTPSAAIVEPASSAPSPASTVTQVEQGAPAPAPAPGSAATVREPTQITLHVHSKPPGAMITVEQKPIGVAPVDAVVARGTAPVAITARLAGRTITVRVEPDHNRDVELALPTTTSTATGNATMPVHGNGATTASPAHGSAAGSDDVVPF